MVSRFRTAVALFALAAWRDRVRDRVGRPGAGTVLRTVNVTIHYSHFDPSSFSFPPGTTVRFVVRNTDPIDHEFIVGDQAVQDAHESGTEAYHPPRPGEMTVPAGTTRATIVTFARLGIAHLRVPSPGALRVRHARRDPHRLNGSSSDSAAERGRDLADLGGTDAAAAADEAGAVLGPLERLERRPGSWRGGSTQECRTASQNAPRFGYTMIGSSVFAVAIR